MSGAPALQRIHEARARLMLRHRFYAVLASYMVPTACGKEITETLAVDGERLFYFPPYIDSISDGELDFWTSHEAAHLSQKHHIRMGARDPEKWNEACDYAINPDLVRLGIGTTPKGCLLDARFAGLGAEEIFSIRAQEARKAKHAQQTQAGAPGQGSAQPGSNGAPSAQQAPSGAPKPGNGQSGAPGQAAPAPSAQGAPGQGNGAPVLGQGQAGAGVPHGGGGVIAPAPDKAAAQAVQWDIRIAQAAAVAAKQAGSMPGEIARAIGEGREAAIDVRALLADLIDSRASVDYSFLKPNRRFAGRGFFLPGTIVDGLEHLVWCIDTSGSIDNHMLANCGAEVIASLESGKVQKLTIIFCDAAVKKIQVFEKGDTVELTPKGGGGTRFSPAFDWIAENAADATACLYLTDLECHDFGSEPDMPVYWLTHGTSRAFPALAAAVPFGEAIFIGNLE